MLVPGSWGRKLPTSNIQEEKYKAVTLSGWRKKKKDKTQHLWPQLQALTSHAPHQAGQVWEARAPNPGALLQLIPVDCCCKEWDQEWSPGHSPTFTLLIMSVPQKLMGSAHFCNLHSLGSDMTCMFLLQ